MVGKRSGMLTVVKRGPNKEDGSARWLCKCDCGNPVLSLLVGQNLRTNRTKSCGCLLREHLAFIKQNQSTLLAPYRNRGTPQALCHPERPHEAKGMCSVCYGKFKWERSLDRNRENSRRYGREHAYTENSAIRNRQLKYNYKITVQYYAALKTEQSGVCACCGNPETARDHRKGKIKLLQVDHDHACCPSKKSCGKCVRGLLCSKCNMILGVAKDNPLLLSRMVNYLNAGGFRAMKALEEQIERCIP